MYRKVLNYLRGQVTVEVESAAPERVLNLCAAHGIPFWELEWQGRSPESSTQCRCSPSPRTEAQISVPPWSSPSPVRVICNFRFLSFLSFCLNIILSLSFVCVKFIF